MVKEEEKKFYYLFFRCRNTKKKSITIDNDDGQMCVCVYGVFTFTVDDGDGQTKNVYRNGFEKFERINFDSLVLLWFFLERIEIKLKIQEPKK